MMNVRSWERQAEDNILERMQKAGLLAPAGEVDKVLNTVVTNLEVTNVTGIGGLDISPDGTRVAVMARVRGTSSPLDTWEMPAPLPGVTSRRCNRCNMCCRESI